MREELERSALLLGTEGIARLERARVAVFGIGGVGGYVVEALVRSGIGTLDLIDSDCVERSNLNRQIIATQDSIGRPKVEVMKERILAVNPAAEVNTFQTFFLPENADRFPVTEYDYIVDAVDTVSAKLALAELAYQAGVPIISAMGAGNKLDASRFEVADIYETSVCPLAKVMRRELRARGIPRLKVVYSKEPPRRPMTAALGAQGDCIESATEPEAAGTPRKRLQTPGSVVYAPAVAGLLIAGEVINDISGGLENG